MPEVVDAFVKTRDWQRVRYIQNRLLNSREGDFSKHAPTGIVPRIRMVWQSLPSQLAKENKKFVYRVAREGDVIFTEFKGALAEQYVMQRLAVCFCCRLRST